MRIHPPIPPLNIHGPDHLVFILGQPLAHTLSPLMHNAAFRFMKLPWFYAPLEINFNEIRKGVEILRSSNVHGANVTVPYKETIIPFLDQVDKDALWLGSVNTLYRKGEKIIGTSTDGEGFLKSLGAWRNKLRGSNGLLLGAGGAAKTVAAALAQSGVNGFYVANRSPERAEGLIQVLLKRFPHIQMCSVSLKEGEKKIKRFDWIVQATSLGLKGQDPSPISLGGARKTTFVIDLIYHRQTAFLKEALQRQLPHLNGLGMLLYQGAISFEYWTGRKAPLALMHKVLRKRLS